MRVAVVGHVEWVEFVRVERVPAAGEIAHGLERWEEAAGGGSVAAVQLARLAGAADFFTALGEDELGQRARERLEQLGLRVRAALHGAPTRRALTFVDAAGERTITTLGERLAPSVDDQLGWDALAGVDAVYFTAGDAGALRAARAARVLVATPRARDAFAAGGGVALDALVYSDDDELERAAAHALEPRPALLVATRGGAGGSYAGADGVTGSWSPAHPPGAIADAYGCGDCFAAALTYALAAATGVDAALALAARAGAVCLTGRGPYGRQLTAAEV